MGTVGLEVLAAAPSQHPLTPVLMWAWEQASTSLAEMRFWSHRLLQTQQASTLLYPPDNKAIWIQRRCPTCPGAWVEFGVGGALPPPTEVQPGKASWGRGNALGPEGNHASSSTPRPPPDVCLQELQMPLS